MRSTVEVALIGGSFNPPHVGHLLAAHYVRATQPVDEVWLLPSFQHPFGKALAPFEHRVRMCQLIAADAAGWLKVSEVEAGLNGQGATVDVLAALRAKHPDTRFTWVIGSDLVKDLPRWKEPERIPQLARLLVLTRAGHPAPEAVGPALPEVSSSEVRARLARGDDVSALVPRAVADYAQQHRVYARRQL